MPFLIWRDLFDPMASAVEVWGGFELHGAAARWSAPIHWLIFALGAWGFWRARPWIVPAAAAYAFYVAREPSGLERSQPERTRLARRSRAGGRALHAGHPVASRGTPSERA